MLGPHTHRDNPLSRIMCAPIAPPVAVCHTMKIGLLFFFKNKFHPSYKNGEEEWQKEYGRGWQSQNINTDLKESYKDQEWWIMANIIRGREWKAKKMHMRDWLIGVFIGTQTFSVPTSSHEVLLSDWARSVYCSRWIKPLLYLSISKRYQLSSTDPPVSTVGW